MGLSEFFVRDRSSKSEKEPEVKDTAGGAPSTPSTPPPVKIREKEEEGVDLIDALLSGKEIISTLETEKYGSFDYRFPTGGDQVAIAHRVADYQGGRPSSSFDAMRRFQFEMWATLDILITRKPERFAKMTSWADCPDQELVEDLYNRGSLFCGSIRQKIRGDDGGGLAQGGQSKNP